MKSPESPIDKARQRINVLMLIDALEQHALGESKMTATQVSAALALLKKVMPDLSSSSGKIKKDSNTKISHEDALKELE